MPLGLGSHGSSGVGAIRSDSLVSGDDGPEGPLDDAFDPRMQEEKLFEAAFQDVNTVFEVGLAARHGSKGWRAVGSMLGIEGT